MFHLEVELEVAYNMNSILDYLFIFFWGGGGGGGMLISKDNEVPNFVMIINSFIVFIVQPNSSSMPNGTQVQLICSVNQEYGVRWSITLPNGTFSTADMDSVERLESEGIMPVPSNITANNAVLIFDGTQNYEATVVCVAVLLTNRSIRCSSQEARVMFYGKSKLQKL